MTVEEKVVKTAPYYKMLQEEGREKGREKSLKEYGAGAPNYR